MPTKKTKKVSKKDPRVFYKISLPIEKEGDQFYFEYTIIAKTVESVNNFNVLYKASRLGAKGGPSTHLNQDLYRAMLVFACAGLDAFVKKLVKDKLPLLVSIDKKVEQKFIEYVQKDLKEDKILNTLALALINNAPRDIFLEKYVNNMTSDSLQSADELFKVSNASGLETDKLLSKTRKASLTEAFSVRHQIVHEMDINGANSIPKTTGYRTRRQRVATDMEKHTKNILKLAEDFFVHYKERFEKFQIGIKKKQG